MAEEIQIVLSEPLLQRYRQKQLDAARRMDVVAADAGVEALTIDVRQQMYDRGHRFTDRRLRSASRANRY